MPQAFPYTFYACPCSEDTSARVNTSDAVEDGPESTFDPRDPRAAYALNSLDHLLFCDDCNQIRCGRCVSEEILNWYCPNCLFETHSTGVRADGNRCSRNCYNCPVCTSTATVVRQHADNGDEEAYILACQYCGWTSLQVDLHFSKPTKITEQINSARKTSLAQRADAQSEPMQRWYHDETFSKMSNFYRDQLAETNDLPGRHGSGGYGSPSNLARIIHMYGGLSHKSLTKAQDRPRAMREAGIDDGLSLYTMNELDEDMIMSLRSCSFENTVSTTQQDFAPVNQGVGSSDQLWPAATKLRTRRGKRCRQCRQFVVRPEIKTTTLRYKIRILARNHIPRISVRPLNAVKPAQHPDFVLRTEHIPLEPILEPFKTYQYVLTLRNPIFETVRITLATPATTNDGLASRATILCPAFSLGPAGDVWDDALSNSTTMAGLTDGGRKAAMASLTGDVEADRQPEAGKVWEQTRSSTSVILELVIGSRRQDQQTDTSPSTSKEARDVLEIPISVRAEWTAEGEDEAGQKGKAEAKELHYWCVIGIGVVGR